MRSADSILSQIRKKSKGVLWILLITALLITIPVFQGKDRSRILMLSMYISY